MKRVLCSRLPQPGHREPLAEGEANHATHVLRLRNGDSVEALDGHGNSVIASLEVRGEAVFLHYVEPGRSSTAGAARRPTVVLELAVLKGDAMEWAVEKSVELGITRLVPLLTAHTVVQTRQKGPEVFQERWQKIANQALKQCGRLEKLEVALPIPLEQHFQASPSKPEEPRLWCDERTESSVALMDWVETHLEVPAVRLLVGPEGGWSALEREWLNRSVDGKSLVRIHLGPLTLRAETAALLGMSVLSAAYLGRSPS